jgi:ribA/ribD-fused uncharacterized protein
MAAGFPISVNGHKIRTVEALYQACRYPHDRELQSKIIEQRSPMTAKMISRKHYEQTRDDWYQVRVKIMKWCLRIKLLNNWNDFRQILLSTDKMDIVEKSRRDDFWGAVPDDDSSLIGVNALGRLLMELRNEVAHMQEPLPSVQPPNVPEFLLLGQPIGTEFASATRIHHHEPR